MLIITTKTTKFNAIIRDTIIARQLAPHSLSTMRDNAYRHQGDQNRPQNHHQYANTASEVCRGHCIAVPDGRHLIWERIQDLGFGVWGLGFRVKYSKVTRCARVTHRHSKRVLLHLPLFVFLSWPSCMLVRMQEYSF